MAKNDLIIRVAGEGGEGVVSTGDFIAAACARVGLEVYTFKTFPAEIKGGYCLYQVRMSDQRVYNQGDTFDVFCAFNGEAFELNKHLLTPGKVLVYDYPGGDFEPEIPEGVIAYPIPMSQTAKELKQYRAKNMVALGALSTLFNIEEETLIRVLTDKFTKKGEKVLNINLQAFEKGKEFAQAHQKQDEYRVADPLGAKDVIIISGNDAVGMGAIMGGLDFFSAYPITPATEIARYVAREIPKVGGTLIQAEDEIASISQVLGASYSGAKSMTATSGPGLALMGEMLGMFSMSETPGLVVDVQRGGPSTGLPTKHEQSDGSLAFSTQTVPAPDPSAFKVVDRRMWNGEGEYKRYELTDDNISPMVDPGTPGGMHMSTGLEHGEHGNPVYTPDNHELMHRKRFDKIKDVVNSYKPVETDGIEGEADLGIITWGSTIGVVREAVQRLVDEGLKVKAFYPKLMWPMPVEQYEAFAKSCGGRLLVKEVNFQGQLSHFIRSETSISPIPYTICGGLPFTPSMVVEKAKEVLS